MPGKLPLSESSSMAAMPLAALMLAGGEAKAVVAKTRAVAQLLKIFIVLDLGWEDEKKLYSEGEKERSGE